LTSKYRSNKSVAKNPTISIDVDDPRVSWDKIKQTLSRQGSEIDIIGLDGKPLIYGGSNLSTGSIIADPNPVIPKVVKVPGVPVPGTPPLPVQNLVGSWGADDSIVLNFDFDTTDDLNFYIHRLLVKVYDPLKNIWYEIRSGSGYLATLFLDSESVAQELTVTANELLSALGTESIISNITKVAVATADILTVGEYVEADMPEYVSPLPQPVFTLSKGVDYYVVTLDPDNIATALANGFFGVIVEEKITPELVKANVSLTSGWKQATGITANSTIVVYTPDGLHRWVRLRYVNSKGSDSVYSDILDITPDPFQPTNTNPPTQFTEANIAWSGNDIVVSFTQPATNAGNTVKVKLVPYVNGVESTSLYAHFYHVIVPPETSFKILSLDMYGQFSAYYSQFKAYITSVSSQGIETNGTVISAGPIQRGNPLANIYPTLGIPNVNTATGIFRVTPSVSGYIVDFDVPAGATRLEVYESPTPWTSIPTNDNLVVYSGLSPASIPSEDNSTRYVIVRYYDQYNNYSHYSMEKVGQTSGVEVIPIDVGMDSLIEFPIKISTNGSIFAGAGDHTVNPKVFFNTAGLFAYDAGGVATTQIINDALANTPTFITQNARIAQWSIDKQLIGTAPNQTTVNYIQNNLYATTQNKNYTGISSNGTYSFWAGATSSLNTDGLAKFSVKPTGEVVATKITINGDGTAGSDLIRAGGSKFIVTQDGDITATSATLSGKLTVTQQSYFDSNVNVRSGYIIAGSGGPNVGPNVQIDSSGLKALNASSAPTTKIYTSPLSITVKNALTGATDSVDGITLWSKKALFGSTEGSGFIISDGKIQSNQIIIDSAQEKIAIRSTTTNSSAGILLQASSSTPGSEGIAIAVGNINDPSSASFRVNSIGQVFANDVQVTGAFTVTGGQLATDLTAINDDIATTNTNLVTTNTNVTNATNIANSKVKTYYDATAPTTGLTAGDIWYHIGNGNVLMKRWTGSQWVLASDFVSGNGVTVDPTTRVVTQIQASTNLVLKSGGSIPVILNNLGLRMNNGTRDTLFLDASNGNATFSGSILASTITGGTVQTGSTAATRRIVMGESQPDRIDFYPKTGDDANLPGYLWVSDDGGSLTLPGIVLAPPTNSAWTGPRARLAMTQTSGGGTMDLRATIIRTYGWMSGQSGFQVTTPAYRNIYAGSASPSGGLEGDVYIQF
jgi:hypothetical protein